MSERKNTEFIVECAWDDEALMQVYVHGILTRCRDCIHYDNGKCKRFLCCVYVGRNHYCGWGERNEN